MGIPSRQDSSSRFSAFAAASILTALLSGECAAYDFNKHNQRERITLTHTILKDGQSCHSQPHSSSFSYVHAPFLFLSPSNQKHYLFLSSSFFFFFPFFFIFPFLLIYGFIVFLKSFTKKNYMITFSYLNNVELLYCLFKGSFSFIYIMR